MTTAVCHVSSRSREKSFSDSSPYRSTSSTARSSRRSLTRTLLCSRETAAPWLRRHSHDFQRRPFREVLEVVGDARTFPPRCGASVVRHFLRLAVLDADVYQLAIVRLYQRGRNPSESV